MTQVSTIDIRENVLRNRGHILDILLSDKTTGKNIIWATDSYFKPLKAYRPYSAKKQILKEQVTGLNGMLIQPRASKSREEQIKRTKEKAEVFTPLEVVKLMNMAVNRASKNWPATANNWKMYIKELRLEITCGEGPFISGRYNPTANTGITIKPKNRVGFLDYKLQQVNKFVDNKKDWLINAEIALKACYGYEWQGDNLLIVRENILLTMDDFYSDFCANRLNYKFRQHLNDEQLENFAEIISWNIFQMDGLKYVIPMSCRPKKERPKQQVFFNEFEPVIKEGPQCDGCKNNDPFAHTPKSKYVKIMDWESGKVIRFVDLLNHNQ